MEKEQQKSASITLSIKDLVIALLFCGIGVLLGFLIFRNSGDSGVASDRRITVDGTAEITSAPEESQYYVEIEQKSALEVDARTQASTIAEGIIADLSDLGVSKDSIKNDVSTYNDWSCYDCSEPDGFVGYANLTIKLSDPDLSDSVYKYLLESEDVSGRITPSTGFSDEQTKELTKQARTEAIADAREQADQLASELGAEVGDVITVNEKQGFDYFGPIYYNDFALEESRANGETTAAELLVGEQDLNFQVEVVFELK